MKKLAIIGASYLQEPLIEKAKSLGIETHVFAWAAGDVGEKSADRFYPISIVEKEAILQKCREIGIDGICSIASDLAAITVSYVANAMGLPGNPPDCVRVSTNKHCMRERFAERGDPSPRSLLVHSAAEVPVETLRFPVIVKPVDRSGSRGITKLKSPAGLAAAIESAKAQGFEKSALVEEFVSGQEYSAECISWQGRHRFLALTQKYTTGAPHFIETAHLEPAPVSAEMLARVKRVVFHALDSLGIVCGASHSELKISDSGDITLIEIGGRMGGDCIGSSLVPLSAGVDFVRAVIQTALGEAPDLTPAAPPAAAMVRFVLSGQDLDVLKRVKAGHPEYLVSEDVGAVQDRPVTDSSTRFGCYVLRAAAVQDLFPYLPEQAEE